MRYVYWLIVGFWVVALLAACGTGTSPAGECVGRLETAVILEINDAGGGPLPGVSVRYRVDDGPWLQLPEPVNGRAALSGEPGQYLIVVEKSGYLSDEAAVTVPPPVAPDCSSPPEPTVLTLARASCPTVPQPLTLTLLAPEPPADLRITVDPPDAGRQELICTVDDSGACRRFTVPVSAAGGYEIRVTGLPDEGRLSVVDDTVSYDYTPFELLLEQGIRRQQITGEGAKELTLTLPVTPDEVNCPLVEMRQMAVSLDPDRATEPEDVAVRLQGSLTMTDRDAAGCEVDPEPLPLTYEVVVPAGTRLSDVVVEVRAGESWETAVCRLEADSYLCTAVLPNPLVGQSYAVRALVDGEEFVDTQIPFDNLCILFAPAAGYEN